jgi:uncharacterized protein DUF1990
MPSRPKIPRKLATLGRWPFGVTLTSWRYLWRTTPLHRDEVEGSLPEDAPPDLPEGAVCEGIQRVEEGAGPFFHRRYRARIADSRMGPEDLVRSVSSQLDRVSPQEFAHFEKEDGEEGEMAVGDEYVVKMAGPWDGPVRVVHRDAATFRLVTLPGHLESGQIEFRARRADGQTVFEIESWARSSDRLTDLLYDHLRMSKEVQLHMWVSTLERIAKLSGGRLDDGLEIHTRKVPTEAFDG